MASARWQTWLGRLAAGDDRPALPPAPEGVEIRFLADDPCDPEPFARWLYAQWSAPRGETLDRRRASLSLHRSIRRLPLALVAAAGAVACMTTALLALGLLPESLTRRTIAAYAVHLGLGIMALGVAFSGPYQKGVERELAVGQSVEVAGYTVTLRDVHEKSSPAMARLVAELEIRKGDKILGVLSPERRMYRGYEQPFAEVEVLPSLGEEIFSVLLGVDRDDHAMVKVNVNPLVNWIWIGGVVFCIAPLFLLTLGRRRGERG